MAITTRAGKGSPLTHAEMDDNLNAIPEKTSATGAVKGSSGTTAQRPSSPDEGYSRFNTDDNRWEVYNGSEWVQSISTANTDASAFDFVVDEDDFSSDSATKVPTQQSIKAYVDTQIAGIDEVVEDSTPQLGGNLDLNSNDIDGTGNIDIDGDITSTGNITTDGNIDGDLIGNTVFRAKASESITKGQVVMFAGGEGSHLLIKILNHSAVGFVPEWIMGVASEDISSGSFGNVVAFGKVSGVDTSSYTEGDILYSNPSVAGGLTSTKPTPTDHILIVCAVTDSASNGSIQVRLSHEPDTDEVPEGSTNLYYTTARANTDFDTRLATKDTDDLTEGSTNQYYTDARVDTYISGGSASALSVTGNVTVGGTVDGRDVATDGTKLDGIESGATADQTDAEIKTAYENNSDTNAYTDAEKSKLAGIESGADVTDSTNVDSAGAVMNTDTTTASMQFVVDEDDMTSDSATKVPTQQSVKAYVDSQVESKDALSELSGTLDDITDGSTYVKISATEQTKLAGIEAGADVTDTANVTSAGALMDSEVTNLAQVKAFDSSDYATSAQGALADSALQSETTTTLALNSNSLDYTDETGTTTNIDLSAYLDEDSRAIASGVLNSVTGVVTFTRDDASTFTLDLSDLLDDTNLVTSVNGANGVVVLDTDDVSEGTTNKYATTANIQSAGALMDSEVTNLAQVKAFDSTDYATSAQGTTADSALQNISEDTTPQLGGNLDTNGNNINFGDSASASDDRLTFGAGNDLQIYHNGANSFIVDSGTGGLVLRGSTYIALQGANTENGLTVNENGSVLLRYDNSDKFATTSTGVSVTGTVTSDGLTVDGISTLGGTGDNYPLVITSTDQYAGIQFQDGVSTNPVRIFNSENDLAFETLNKLRVQISENGDVSFREDTGTTAKFFWDASAERLGIGTTSPFRQLQVGDYSGNAEMSLGASTSGTSSLYFADGDSAPNKYVGSVQYNHASNYMLFNTNGTERMRIDSSGNVGIGTSSLGTHTLNVACSSTDAYSGVKVDGSRNGVVYTLHSNNANSGTNTGTGIWFSSGSDYPTGAILCRADGTASSGDSAGYLTFHTTPNASGSPTERMRIDSSGNVGIGTSSPTDKLHINSGTSNRCATFESTDTGAGINFKDPTSTGFNGFQFDGSVLRVFGADTERMRIDSSGNMLLGTTSSRSGNTAKVEAKVGSETPFLSDVNATTPRYAMELWNPNGLCGNISTNGTSASFNSSSDYRLKENVVDMDGAIDRVKALQPKRFNFIVDADTTVDGFLAHEVSSTVPEAVTGTHNEVDENNNPVYQSIDQSKLVPLLTGALQEAIAKIEALETRIETLEGA